VLRCVSLVVCESGVLESLTRAVGCRCRFTLPVVDEDSSEATDFLSALAHDADQTTNGLFGHLDVLLVEDNAINQKVGLRMLSTLGCNTRVADNGEECLKLLTHNLNESPFDIVLMDCQMPGTSPNPHLRQSLGTHRRSSTVMDGFEATQRIRRMGVERHGRPITIIALTASATKVHIHPCTTGRSCEHHTSQCCAWYLTWCMVDHHRNMRSDVSRWACPMCSSSPSGARTSWPPFGSGHQKPRWRMTLPLLLRRRQPPRSRPPRSSSAGGPRSCRPARRWPRPAATVKQV
jgi:CheY-like chemotaxis protein